MKHRRTPYAIILIALCVLGSTGYASAQRRDPLNEKEVDEMRESADLPDNGLS